MKSDDLYYLYNMTTTTIDGHLDEVRRVRRRKSAQLQIYESSTDII